MRAFTHRRIRIALTAIVLLVVTRCAVIAAPTQVRIVSYGEDDNLKKIAQVFNASHPDIQLVIETYPFNDYIDKVTTMMLGNASPDILQTWAQYKAKWAQDGVIRDLTGFWEKNQSITKKFFPFVAQSARYNGRYYGVPHDFNSQCYILQTDYFDDAGIKVPVTDWTVNDFKNMAIKFTNKRRQILGVSNGVAFGWGGSWQWTQNWTGHGWMNANRTEPMVEDPANIDMLQFWHDLAYQYSSTNAGSLQAGRDVWTGGYVMWEGWVSFAFQLAMDQPYTFSLAAYPKAPKGQNAFAQGHMWSIPRNAPHPEAAETVLQWMLSPEGQEAFVKYASREPLSPDPRLWDIFFATLPSNTRNQVKGFLLDTLYGRNLIDNFEYWPTWSAVNDVMVKHLADVFLNQDGPANAMAKAAQEIRGIVGTKK